jgi:creatinine amidohydrolase
VSNSLYLLAEMTWPEFEVARETIDLAVIPLGATEQHGPHGTFAIDTGRAEGFAKRLGERLYPRAVVCPVVPYGISPHHMGFPGTITLTGATFIKVLEEIVDSLYRHGMRKFFFPNSHGGNRPALELLMGELTYKYPDVKAAHCVISRMAGKVYAAETHSDIMGHACEGEMSQAMVLAPYTVRTEALKRADIKYSLAQWERRKVFPTALTWDEITASGDLGDATKASPELGEKIVSVALDNLVECLREF